MIYLAKEFGYRVSGIDYSDSMPYVRENLRFNGICDAELFHCDLFQFVPPRQYDLVFSQGFVEHFDDYALVVRKHEVLAAPDGLVVIIVPNLTHLHRVLCGHFAPEILSVHRFPLMHARVLRKTLEDAGLEVLHCAYHKTFRPTYRLPRPLDLCSRALQKGLRVLHLDNIGNRFGSPYLISVSRKPSTLRTRTQAQDTVHGESASVGAG
jgi:cyclopropane fatty-acyl-phospholipid synthase-like methyltransferase